MTNLFEDVYACKNEQAKNNAIAAVANVLNKCLSDNEKTALKAMIRKSITGNHFDENNAYHKFTTQPLMGVTYMHHLCPNVT